MEHDSSMLLAPSCGDVCFCWTFRFGFLYGIDVTFSGWWFGTFFMFPYIWNNHPNWLSYFSEGFKPPTSFDLHKKKHDMCSVQIAHIFLRNGHSANPTIVHQPGTPFKVTDRLWCLLVYNPCLNFIWLVVWLPSILFSQKWLGFRFSSLNWLSYFSEGFFPNHQPVIVKNPREKCQEINVTGPSRHQDPSGIHQPKRPGKHAFEVRRSTCSSRSSSSLPGLI